MGGAGRRAGTAVDRTHLIGAAVAVLAAVAGALWYMGDAPGDPPPVTVVHSVPEAGPGVTVHVSGAVGEPGLVRVAEGARVADVIAAAGGALPGADLGAVNLAARVADGQRLAIPSASSGPDRSASVSGDGERIALNSASASELQALPGVGPVLADRIVAHRERHGPFGTVEDLLDVPGIGEGKLAALRESVQVP